MATSATTPPAIARDDAGLALSSKWTVGTSERLRAALEANAAVWEQVPWPEGLLRHECLIDEAGGTMLHYHQWVDDDAYGAFVRSSRDLRTGILDEAVPGIRRHGLTHYRLHRSHRPQHEPAEPGCVVAIDIGTEGPRRAGEWIDAVMHALKSEEEPHAGLLSANFHISHDGTRVFNYAEWTDEQAHRRALGESGSIGRNPAWEAAQHMPGVRQLGFERFRPGRSFFGHSHSA